MATSFKHALLLKEIELINGNIKNLDDIIYKTKNFAFLMWGGSLFLIVEHIDPKNADNQLLIFFTALIPLIFWLFVDYQWRKHLKYASARETIISKFINSDQFEATLTSKVDEALERFPLLDPAGWIYTEKNYPDEEDHKYPNHYLHDTTKITKGNVLFYKDAKYFYGTMILISLIFGFFYK